MQRNFSQITLIIRYRSSKENSQSLVQRINEYCALVGANKIQQTSSYHKKFSY